MAGTQHVGEREQRRRQRVVLTHAQLEQGSVGVGDAQRLGLRAVHAAVAKEGDVHAFGLQPLVAELAGAVRGRKRHHHQVAPFERAHLRADVLDDADRLVAHRLAGLARLHRRVWPQVAAADAGAGHTQDRVGRLDQCGVGNGLGTDVARGVHHGRSHALFCLSCRGLNSWSHRRRRSWARDLRLGRVTRLSHCLATFWLDDSAVRPMPG